MNTSSPRRILAGDIGGTKTRLAVFEVSGHRLTTLHEATYPSGAHPDLESIVERFLAAHEGAVAAAGFGIAGPVRSHRVEVTNLPWVVDAHALSARFRIGPVFLLNDLEANAWGIQALEPEDLLLLYPGGGEGAGNGALIAAGTGLGEAGMFYDGRTFRPFATEGGHADFAPGDELQIELLRFLQARHGHVSWERVVSGPGLVDLHAFLQQREGSPAPRWLQEEMRAGDPAAAISRAGMGGRDGLCEAALSLFVRLYGAEAGNLALKHMATGGLYVGGGIAPKILERLRQGDFVAAFLEKGRMRALLEAVPIRVILNDHTALYGPALYAADRLREGAVSP